MKFTIALAVALLAVGIGAQGIDPPLIACDDAIHEGFNIVEGGVFVSVTRYDPKVCNCSIRQTPADFWVPWIGPWQDYDGQCFNGKCGYWLIYLPEDTSCTLILVTVPANKCLVRSTVEAVWTARLLCDENTPCPIVRYAPFTGIVHNLEFEDCPGG